VTPLTAPLIRPSSLHRAAARTRNLALAVALAAVSTHAALAADPKASQLYEDALSRFEKKDTAGAIVQLKNALQIDKKMLPVHVLLGKSLLAQGDVIAAEVAFDEALRLGVSRAEILIPLGKAVLAQSKARLLLEDTRFDDKGLSAQVQHDLYILKASASDDTGDRKGALKFLAQARAIDGKSPDSWLAEVKVRIRAGQAAEAEAAAEQAIALAPGNAEVQYSRGTVAHVKGDLKTALASYDKALQFDPSHAEALVSRAGLLMDLNRLADAKRDVDAVLKIESRDPRGSYLSALIAEREGRSADAKAALANVAALLDPAPMEMFRYRPQFLMLGGLAHFGLGETEKAKPYLEILLRDQPGSPVSKLMANIHLKEGNAERAVETLEAYLRLQPADAQATLLLASANMAMGRHARATALLQAAIARDDRAEYRNALGMALLKTGQFDSALTELQAAFERDPRQVQSGTALAALYLQLGQAAKAVKVAEQLNKSRPDQPGLLHLLGTARAQAGDVKGAREALERAAGADVNFVDPQVELARLDLRAGAVEAALNRLNGVITKFPKHVGALTLLGQVFEGQRRLAEAQTWLEKADDHSAPDNLDAGVRLVTFHLAHGQVDRARLALKRLTAKNPEGLRTLLMQARVDLAAGDVPTARSALKRASSAAGFEPAALAEVAELQLTASDTAAAAHTVGKLIKEAPKDFAGQVLMARVETLQQDFPAAERRARQIVAAYPKRGIGQTLLGDIALAREQTAAAVSAYRRAHQIEGSSMSLLQLFAVLTRTNPPEGIRVADQWLKAHPSDRAVRRAMADAQARAGNWPAARQAYELLLKSSPNDAETANNLANVLLIQKDPSALKVAEQALALKPDAAHIISTAGWAAHQAGRTERALQLLRDARLRDPESGETRFYLASVLAAAGRPSEAKVELEAALKGPRPYQGADQAEKLRRTLN
jgi:cellulose synthase operon protein C